MKKLKYILLSLVLCFAGIILIACEKNESGNLHLQTDKESEIISSGLFKMEYPVLVDDFGNVVISYKIAVASIVSGSGEPVALKDGVADFSKQGEYTVTYNVPELPRIEAITKKYVVVDETPPQITEFDYPESVIVGRKYPFPDVKLFDAAGVNEEKTGVEVIDKYNNAIASDDKGFTVSKSGDYKFRIMTEDNNGVSKTYYYPFVAFAVENPIDGKVGYFDEESGCKQIATGLTKGENDERYTVSYTTEKSFGDEKGSTVITVNENPTTVYFRLIAPYFKDVTAYSRLTFRIYVEVPDREYTSVLCGAYSGYKNIDANKWVEMTVSTAALNENGSILNGLTGERIIANDITNLTMQLFSWSNPAYGGVEDKEGFPAGTKIYISSMVAKERDPSVIYEFTADEGDHGAMAINKATGEPVESYGGNVEHGSFSGVGQNVDSVRFYLQTDPQGEAEYLVYLPVIDFKLYGTVVVELSTNNCKKVGVSAESCIDFADVNSLTVTFVYVEETGNLSITFTSGNKTLTVVETDQDVINGYAQFELYAVGAAYTEIYINPIKKG